MAVQKDFRSGRIASLAAGASSLLVDESLTGQELYTVERMGAKPHADLRLTLTVEKTTVYKQIPTTAAAYPVADANAEVFLCTPVVGVLPEKRWQVLLENVGAGAVTNIDWLIALTKYTGADLQRVL